MGKILPWLHERIKRWTITATRAASPTIPQASPQPRLPWPSGQIHTFEYKLVFIG